MTFSINTTPNSEDSFLSVKLPQLGEVQPAKFILESGITGIELLSEAGYDFCKLNALDIKEIIIKLGTSIIKPLCKAGANLKKMNAYDYDEIATKLGPITPEMLSDTGINPGIFHMREFVEAIAKVGIDVMKELYKSGYVGMNELDDTSLSFIITESKEFNNPEIIKMLHECGVESSRLKSFCSDYRQEEICKELLGSIEVEGVKPLTESNYEL